MTIIVISDSFYKLFRFQTGERRQRGVCGGIGRQTRGLAKFKFTQVPDIADLTSWQLRFILKNHDSDETGRNEKLSRPNENSQTFRKDRFVIQNSNVTLKTNLERNNYVILNFRFFKPSKPSVSKITSSRIWVHSDGCRRVWSRQINLGQCAKSFL